MKFGKITISAKLLNIISLIVASLALTIASTASTWWLYQPKTPKSLRK